MKVSCPQCNKETVLPVAESVTCQHCQSDLNVKKAIGKRLLPLWMILALGGYAGHRLDDALEVKRYPLAFEYALIDTCLKGSGITASQWISSAQKLQHCQCAIEKVEGEIAYHDITHSKALLNETLREAFGQCR
ncbi:MAG: hypothetical protein VX447_09160 [Pseudomonadota bacterium]|uniref:hypothetical protein n=1 Tax=Gallaecimonas pentaromativorans TaxID=584787 RepID=UPI0012ECCC61|nr:hypothetical protein [Gallaecimonas pentaromativorans]MED5524906.1 hypothetical protein [Pseudomonadota bacterium]